MVLFREDDSRHQPTPANGREAGAIAILANASAAGSSTPHLSPGERKGHGNPGTFRPKPRRKDRNQVRRKQISSMALGTVA